MQTIYFSSIIFIFKFFYCQAFLPVFITHIFLDNLQVKRGKKFYYHLIRK